MIKILLNANKNSKIKIKYQYNLCFIYVFESRHEKIVYETNANNMLVNQISKERESEALYKINMSVHCITE